jgi:hypothetical protein
MAAPEYLALTSVVGHAHKLAHEEAGKLQAKAWNLFVNIDGAGCRKICPLPHQQLGNFMVKRGDIERVDAMSCRERFEQIKDQLTEEESALLLSLILHISGGNLDNSSLWDMIRSHALAAHSSDNFEDVWLLYKLREGQSVLAKRMFDEAVNDGLDYAFSTEVASISDWGQQVEVAKPSGERFRASQVISTIPLNVLRHIRFEPPLSPLRQEAVNIGHVNFMNKIHAEVKGSGLASWNGMSFPNILMYGYGDGVLNNGNAHIVAFGTDERATGYVAEKCPEQTIEAFQKLHPMKVEKMVCWSVELICNMPANFGFLDLPQLEHRPLLSGGTSLVGPRLHEPLPGRASEPSRKRPICFCRLGSRMESLYRRSHRAGSLERQGRAL